mmetsp:Transcript_45583/g.67744  ORF Transcript_45583/g.67744 Transcript_45583/m.67744 type:complete len:215 (+) Transcript_45583:219-863(+)
MFRLHGHFSNTTCVVSNRSIVVHTQDVNGVAQHPHGCHSGTKQTSIASIPDARRGANVVGHQDGHCYCDRRNESCLQPPRDANNDVHTVSTSTCLCNRLNRMTVVVCVVLCRQDDNVGTRHTHNTTQEELPCRSWLRWIFEQPVCNNIKPDNAQQECHSVSLLELLHGVGVGRVSRHTYEGNPNRTHNDIHGMHHKREEEELGSDCRIHSSFVR